LKRIALLFALCVVAVLMLRASLANILRRIDPAVALSINPANGEAAEARAEQLMIESVANRSEAAALARRALDRSPVSAGAARILATAKLAGGNVDAARRLMTYSERVSRRDLPTQAWLIEDAVQRDDIPMALHHYDVALRSVDQAKALLLPILVKAIAQPPVVDSLIVTLAARPLWAPTFLDMAARDGRDFEGLARLLEGLARQGYSVPMSVTAQASARMVEAGYYDLAWRVYAAGHPHAARSIVRDPGFARIETDGAGPFEWSLVAANGLTAQPRRYGGQSVLSYNAATGAGGILARQLLLLPTGAARLAGRSYDSASSEARAQLRLTCANSGKSIMTMAANMANYAQGFVIPADCPAQWLDVTVDGGDSPLGTSGAIGGLHILPDNERWGR
jgi:hypothetical protein